jgi:hypothetical protein
MLDEPYIYLDQAHALADILADAAVEADGLKGEIVQAAANGIATLIHLAAFGQATMEYNQRRRRAGGAA